MLEKAAIKRAVDLRDFVRRSWGEPIRRTAGYDVYRSMWREDGQRASFTVYDDRYKDYGGSGESGDIIAFVQREQQLNFVEALRWLADYAGLAAADRPHYRRSTGLNSYTPKPITLGDQAPDPQWQQCANSALRAAQTYLWSNRADALRVRAYLRQQRGLSDETMRAAGYGYVPRWQRLSLLNPNTNKALALAPGIVEPWFYDGQLWALRVRCRVGSLATALEVREDQLYGTVAPKYINLAGSVARGALYNGDAFQPGDTVLLVEGGFDAMLATQVLSGEPMVSVPSPTLPAAQGGGLPTGDPAPTDGSGDEPTLPPVTLTSPVGAGPVRPAQPNVTAEAQRRRGAEVGVGEGLRPSPTDGSRGAQSVDGTVAATSTTNSQQPTTNNQHRGGIVALTLGSATNRLSDALLARLRLARRVLLLLDADDAGQQGQSKLLAALGDKAIPLHLPAGQDVTDFVLSGGDLAQLVDDALRPAWWQEGVPDTVRSALLRYCPGAVALVVELLQRATEDRLLRRDGFTLNELLAANESLGFDVPERTLRRAFKAMVGALWQVLPAPVAHAGRGRPAVQYTLVDRSDFNQTLVDWATPRIYEAHHPTTGDGALLANPTPQMLTALGYDEATAAQLVDELRITFERVFRAQDHAEIRATETALQEVADLKLALRKTDSTSLPTGWPLSSITLYRAALLRATNDPEQRRSRREICRLLGAANGSVGAYLERAGLQRLHETGEYAFAPITRADDLEFAARRHALAHKGYPKRLVVHDAEGQVLRDMAYAGDDSRGFVAEHLANGHSVTLKLQVANHYVAVSDGPVEPASRGKSGGDSGPAKRPRYYGPAYDPRWVRDQLQLGLERLGRVQVRAAGLVDVLTGEVYAHETDGRGLLRLLGVEC